ncbi:arginase family protein [Zunongwangia pacifica]|uniref:Arginase family protein n=1 Tax=Zunongwangia pacifica TaxID=2911062 RepID=A0A9X1ZNZ0_9FLAO|nr:arginase family protein [Zunongwangia pacifica]MCL6218307.1 arginase family protein [Zunongwangia pacifica]
MRHVHFYNFEDIQHKIASRQGETKFGEKVDFVKNTSELSNLKQKYILLGIPEDIGVRANYGKPGTSKAWDTFLYSFLNIQVNDFTYPYNIAILGELSVKDLMKKASKFDKNSPDYFTELGQLVEEIDNRLSAVIAVIVAAGKIPIIIGGGHNNAFGNIKGTATALNSAINVLNIDAHTDLRQLEHRHSGNGFSFAKSKGFLSRYFIFGLHQNYTPQYIFDEIKADKSIQFQLFEYLMGRDSNYLQNSLKSAADFVAEEAFGLEIDCDSIKDFSSSAQTPSGIQLEEIRNFLKTYNFSNCTYLHLCEAAPPAENPAQVGKALSYLVSDFISEEKVIEL